MRPLSLVNWEMHVSWHLKHVHLIVVGAEFVRDVVPGEFIMIDDNGLRSEVFAFAC